MQNWQVAAALERMAGLLALKGEKDFKVRAYSQAARQVIRTAEPLAALIEAGKLEQLPGIGPALARKITELVKSGRSEFLARLEAEVPSSLLALFSIPGVGYKTAATLVQKLQLQHLDQLEEAARAGRVAELAGLGPRLEQNIIHFFEQRRHRTEKFHRGVAVPLADQLTAYLLEHTAVAQAGAAGELRRGVELVSEVVLVVALRRQADRSALEKDLLRQPGLLEASPEENGLAVRTVTGVPVRFSFTGEKEFPTALAAATGSGEHWSRLVALAREAGLKLDQEGLFGRHGRVLLFEEADLYAALGLPPIPPELREDGAEIGAAQEGRLPQLIEADMIRGDLHLHSDWSDGVATIEAMAATAEALGYEYAAITDHSPSLQIAGGLSPERLRRQIAQIRSFNEKNPRCRLFSGIEVDIRPDGSLDLPDDLLDELDVVVASVHSHFKQGCEEMTARICRAMEHPAVQIIGHPTGRLLGSRGGYQVDVERLIRQAAATGTILELNASPQRLDLPDIYLRRAREAGVLLTINTDAHSPVTMEDMSYGVTAARRGWLEGADVLNTLPRDRLEKMLKVKRRHGCKR